MLIWPLYLDLKFEIENVNFFDLDKLNHGLIISKHYHRYLGWWHTRRCSRRMRAKIRTDLTSSRFSFRRLDFDWHLLAATRRHCSALLWHPLRWYQQADDPSSYFSSSTFVLLNFVGWCRLLLLLLLLLLFWLEKLFRDVVFGYNIKFCWVERNDSKYR